MSPRFSLSLRVTSYCLAVMTGLNALGQTTDSPNKHCLLRPSTQSYPLSLPPEAEFEYLGIAYGRYIAILAETESEDESTDKEELYFLDLKTNKQTKLDVPIPSQGYTDLSFTWETAELILHPRNENSTPVSVYSVNEDLSLTLKASKELAANSYLYRPNPSSQHFVSLNYSEDGQQSLEIYDEKLQIIGKLDKFYNYITSKNGHQILYQERLEDGRTQIVAQDYKKGTKKIIPDSDFENAPLVLGNTSYGYNHDSEHFKPITSVHIPSAEQIGAIKVNPPGYNLQSFDQYNDVFVVTMQKTRDGDTFLHHVYSPNGELLRTVENKDPHRHPFDGSGFDYFDNYDPRMYGDPIELASTSSNPLRVSNRGLLDNDHGVVVALPPVTRYTEKQDSGFDEDRKIFYHLEHNQAQIITYTYLCFEAHHTVTPSQAEPRRLACSASSTASMNSEPPSEQLLGDQLCQSTWTESLEDLEKLFPNSVDFPLEESLALRYLKRFQKPEAIDPKKHLEVFYAILNSDLVKTHGQWVNGALQNLALTDESAYIGLIGIFPSVLDLAQFDENPCRTKVEKQKLQEKLKQYLNERFPVSQDLAGIALNAIQSLKPLKSLLIKLEHHEKDKAMEGVAERIQMNASFALPGTFESQLYYFSHNVVAPYFGEESKELTDFSLIRQDRSIEPIILSSAPLGENEDPGFAESYGFHTVSLPKIELPSDMKEDTVILDEKYSWQVNQQTYSAAVQIQGRAKEFEVPRHPAAPKKEMLADGKLTGFMVPGSNLKKDFERQHSAYQAYFASRGFSFAKPYPVEDFAAFIGQKVANNEIDYLFKDAHSGGDDKNFVEIPGQVWITEASKGWELVYLVSVNNNTERLSHSSAQTISHENWKTWLDERAEKKGTPIICVAATCTSTHTAACHLEHAGSCLLSVIPSRTTVNGLSWEEDDPETILLDAIRSGRPYQEVRDQWAKKKDKDEAEFPYLFPDENAYLDSVLSNVKYPVETRIQITDPNGRAYQFSRAVAEASAPPTSPASANAR